jgi:hypothetical protein
MGEVNMGSIEARTAGPTSRLRENLEKSKNSVRSILNKFNKFTSEANLFKTPVLQGIDEIGGTQTTEDLGETLLKITTRTRTPVKKDAPPEQHPSRPTPQPDKQPTPKKEDKQTPPSKKPNFFKRYWKQLAISAAALLGLGGVGTGAYEAYQNDIIPGIHRVTDISSSFDILNGKKIVKDNQMTIISQIGDNNTLNTTLETIQNAPSFDSDGNPLLYITPPKQGDTIKCFFVTSTINAVLSDGTNTTVNSISINEEVGKDYPLRMPIDGSVVAYCDDKGNFLNFWVYFIDADGKQKRINCGAYDRQAIISQNIPTVTAKDENPEEKGAMKKVGTTILTTSKPTNVFYSTPTNSKDGGVGSLDIRPLTITDDSGQTKIPIIE